jgi:hypothetical protein
MLVCLAVFFKNIYAYGQIVTATILSDDRPSLFCPQFADSSSPFFLVLGQIFELFAGYFLANVLAKIL